MDLSGIISISGRPGLYRVIAQGKNNVIVESLTDKKRFPAYSTDRISALNDISIYTLEEDKPLQEIYTEILDKIGDSTAPSHKESLNVLQDFLVDILPNYDDERVYPSDIKKLFQWYNLLWNAGIIKPEEKKKEVETEKKATVKKAAPANKPPAKKKTIPNKETAQKVVSKKIVSKKPISKKK
tara:strand:- start:51 stop:599 length:549 start_codon:yes stop_codon:yes gene_type:complete